MAGPSLGVSCFGNDGRTVFSSHLGAVKEWDAAMGACLATQNSEDVVNAVAVSSEGRTLVAGCDRGRLTLWSRAAA